MQGRVRKRCFMTTKISKILSGVAGEYFVAAELSRRGLIASITLRNSRSIDLICATEDAQRSVSIQVKTNQGSDRSWLMSKSAETLVGENLFYVFVCLNGLAGAPQYHIVESCTVAEHCRSSHENWLKGTKLDGSARKDTPMRVFRDPDCEFVGAWDRLGLTKT